MPVRSAGENFDLSIDANILRINSPQDHLEGPYRVVYKQNDVGGERWAIVALLWDGEPRLGIRWFHDNSGNPLSRLWATWLVIPSLLTPSVVRDLPIDENLRLAVGRFLAEEMTGDELEAFSVGNA